MKLKKPTLVDDWKRSWRWFSVNCMTLAASIQGAYMALPYTMQQTIPLSLVSSITISLLVLGIVGRLVKQS